MAKSALSRRERGKQERRPNAQRTADTRKALIEATIQCLCEIGYSRTTTLEISRRAAITPGALQHHFGRKDELIIATLDKLMVEMAAVLDKAEQVEGAEREKIDAFVEHLWSEFYGHPRYMAVWEIVVGSRGEPELHPRVAAHRAASVEKCEQVWCRAFGLKRGTADPRIRALHFALNYLRGSAILPILPRDEGNSESIKESLKTFLAHEFARHGG